MKGPRFVAEACGPRYGARDEFVGWTAWHTEAVAETLAFLDLQLERRFGEYTELDWRITDREPEREVANWGPRLPFGTRDEDWVPGPREDLPF